MIRRTIPADAPGISRLLTQLGYPGTAEFIGSRLTKLLANPDEIVLVWAEESHVLAFLSLHFSTRLATGDFAEITYFAVDETVQSKGIGRQMEAEATRLARERDCDRMVVHCHTRRTRAHDFYRRQGFEESPKYLIKKLK